MTRAALLTVVAALTISVAAPSGAHASFGAGADLVSASPTRLEQADENVVNPVISADGRYVVFQTTARNLFADDDPDPPGQIRLGGIFRRDLQTGALDVVAYGNLQPTSGSLLARGAQNPSVSADGRYVAFSSGWKLVPADTNPNVDVYVRDMTKPVSAPDAYALASAKDGSTTGASYGSTAMSAGADIPSGKSISADGTKVLFRTGVASDLPNAAGTTTPSGQLFVRDLEANTTTLVTRKMADGSPAGGALGQPATLSADGTTVAWPGLNASQQTPFLLHEVANDSNWRFYLWRRIADGPSAPTRRITGAVDLDDPGCAPPEQDAWADDPTASGPCYGPFISGEGTTFGDISGLAPALSSDGYSVAFQTSTFFRGVTAGIFVHDLYVTDMHPGVSRKDGTFQITTHSLNLADPTTNSSILSVAMSADGKRLAFTTQRTNFIHPSLRFVGAPLALPERVQLYAADLGRGEIQLVSRGLDGGGANGDVAAFPSITADGSKVAFATPASNLFPGDANERADAFVATDRGDAGGGGGSTEPPFGPYSSPAASQAAKPTLKLKSRSGHGRIMLTVRVPAAGTVSATARSRRGTVAKKTAKLARAGSTTLVLTLKARYRRQLHKRHRIPAEVTVRYAPPGSGPGLSAKTKVTFTR